MAEASTSRSQRFFVNDTGSSRRPIDLMFAAIGVVVVLLSALAASDGDGPLDAAVRRVATHVPDWVTNLFDAAYALGAAYAVVAVLLALASGTRHKRLLLTLAIAAAAGVVGVLLTSFLVGAGWPDVSPGPVRSGSVDSFPTVRVAATTAILFALLPWLVLAYRRLTAVIIGVQCVAAWIIGIGGPTDVIGALGVGMVAAGVALLLVGSPGGHPDLAHVERSLADLHVPVSGLRFAEHQSWGVRVLHGTTAATGDAIVVKVYGRDATDAHRAERWWRSLLYRDMSSPESTRLQLVEHEALVTMLAERAGVAVPALVAAAEANGDAVLVLREPPPSLAHATDIDDTTLRAIWASVARLHGAALVHGRLHLDRIGVVGDTPVLSGFAEGRVAATENERAREVAILLIALGVRVGAERAAEAALAELGDEDVAKALPYLQRAVLPREVRPEPGVKETIPAVAAVVTERTGVPAPPPAPLVRVRWRDLAQVVLIAVAAYALLSTLVGLDWATVLDTWKNADWKWVALGLVIAQATSVADSISTMSAVPSRLPLGPLVQLQYGIKTLGLAVSASVGRIALNTSFLRRYGEGPAVAVSAAALDAAAASLCNVLVVVLGLLLVDRVPDVHLTGPDDLAQLIELLLVVAVISVLAVVLIPKLRHKVAAALKSSVDAVKVVTASPARALLMFGSNLASLLITAIALACMSAGLYPGVSYGEAVFVVGAAALFSALVPVPGNVGVAEAALTAGLVAIGVPSGPAFAMAVTQRIATSYLPPVYGGWALGWLRKNDYID